MKARFFDKGLQQQGSIAITLAPMAGKYPGRLRQYHGSQVLRLHPGQDRKAGIVDDQMEMAFALFVTPADVTISRCALPSGGAKAEQGNRMVCGVNKISQLGTGKRLVAEV